jgi:hypothetical protein
MKTRELLLAVVAFAGCGLVEVIPPRDMTVTAMVETWARIGIYLEKEGRLPKSLDILPVRQGYANSTTDGWDRPLIYQIDGDGFTLTSLGRDGVPGGTGDDADVVKKYRVVAGKLEEIKP